MNSEKCSKTKRTRLVAFRWRPDRGCTVCGLKSKLRCSQCKCAFYCSKKHQTFDWAMHRVRCCYASTLVKDSGFLSGEAALIRAATFGLRAPELTHVKEVLWDYRSGALSASALAPALAPALAYAQDPAQASELMGRLGCLHPHLVERHREVLAALEKMRPKFEPSRFPIISDPFGLRLLLANQDNLDSVKVAAIDLLIDYMVDEVGSRASHDDLRPEELFFTGSSFFAAVYKAGVDATLAHLISSRYLKVPGWPDELHQLAIGLMHSIVNWTCQIVDREKSLLLYQVDGDGLDEEAMRLKLNCSQTTYGICYQLNELFKEKLGKLYLLLSNVDRIDYMTPEEGKVWIKAFNALKPFAMDHYQILSPLVQMHLCLQGYKAVSTDANSRVADLYFSESFFIHSIVTQGIDEFYDSITTGAGILQHIQSDLVYRKDQHIIYPCLAVFESNLNSNSG